MNTTPTRSQLDLEFMEALRGLTPFQLQVLLWKARFWVFQYRMISFAETLAGKLVKLAMFAILAALVLLAVVR